MIKRKAQTSPKDKYKFIAYILNKVKLTTEHRKTEKKDGERRFKKKTSRDLGPRDTTVHTREGGPTVQVCGDSNVACKWIYGEHAQGTKYKERYNWENSKNLAPMAEERSCHTDL